MSYPHAVRRMKHHRFFADGWARALPIVLGKNTLSSFLLLLFTCLRLSKLTGVSANILLLLFGTVIFLRLVGYYNREQRRRRLGFDSSMSPGTL